MGAGWAFDPDDAHPQIHVVPFADQPVAEAVTYATIGLSNVELHVSPQKHIAQELLFCCYARFGGRDAAAVPYMAAVDVRREQRPLLRGHVVGPRGPLFDDSELEALYCAPPWCFPESLAAVDEPGWLRIVLVWLIPITHAEAHFVFDHGWSRFERLLVEENADVFDLQRASAV